MQEISSERTQEPVSLSITLQPDVKDFLDDYSHKGSASHIVNAVLRIYRDSLPPAKVKAPAAVASTDAKPQKARKSPDAQEVKAA